MKITKRRFNYAVHSVCLIPDMWWDIIKGKDGSPTSIRIGMTAAILVMPAVLFALFIAILLFEDVPERFREYPLSAYFLSMLNCCHYCYWRRATWSYMPGIKCACDGCVPRGCSCTMEPIDGDCENEDPANWDYAMDDKGRKVPCCEWW